VRVAWILVMPNMRMKKVLTGAVMVTSIWRGLPFCTSWESWFGVTSTVPPSGNPFSAAAALAAAMP
jgi:hypothetical protein